MAVPKEKEVALRGFEVEVIPADLVPSQVAITYWYGKRKR
jgi:hypothetical protein